MSNNYKDKKRSPLKKESLRHAGQSLNERIDDLIYKEIVLPSIIILCLLLFAFIDFTMTYFNLPNTPWVYVTSTLILGCYFGIRMIKIIKEIKNIKLGRDGECLVAESLEELRVFGYKVYNDIVDKTFNIDHIVIGPAGVFTIETKTYRKQNNINSKVHYDGVSLRIDGANFKKDPLQQAKGQMYWLQGFIEDTSKIKIKVQPVVVFPGWFINTTSSDVEVLVMNEKMLFLKLKDAKAILNKEQIDLISSHLESYIRNN